MQAAGKIVLFGSGESATSGRKVWDWLFASLEERPQVAILETPAGFEPNSAAVAGQVGDFVTHRLQNFDPQVTIIAARKRGTLLSPDNPDLLQPLLDANVIFLGPGSPTYAVRQLQGSLAWQALVVQQQRGAVLVLASAMAVAASVQAMPVYEIYKVGEELHWKAGLDLFALYNLSLVFVPHWNNNDGGEKLDTSRCYLGRARFEALCAMLPPDCTIVGLDERTALVVEPADGVAHVMGQGHVTLQRGSEVRRFPSGSRIALTDLGPFRLPTAEVALPRALFDSAAPPPHAQEQNAPAEVLNLAAERHAARTQRDWARADLLRRAIQSQGWLVRDTAEGPRLELVPLAEHATESGTPIKAKK